MGDHQDLIVQLESVADALGDRALDALRAAVESGATHRPAEEKALVRARRAVDKAVHILRDLDERPGG